MLAMRLAPEDNSYHSRSEDESPRRRIVEPKASGHNLDALQNAVSITKSQQAASAIVDIPTPPKTPMPVTGDGQLVQRNDGYRRDE